jgi:hypothetical protein
LQYFTGTSIAVLAGRCDFTINHAVVGGARVSGSSPCGGGGKRCKFRGRIPGSESEACTKEEKHINATYANTTGTAGLTRCQSQEAWKTKNRIAGTMTRMPVAMLTGRSRAFWKRPPRKKRVLPGKWV